MAVRHEVVDSAVRGAGPKRGRVFIAWQCSCQPQVLMRRFSRKCLAGEPSVASGCPDRWGLPCLPSTQRERPAMRSEISRDALRATRAFCTLLARAHCSGHGAQVVFGMRKNVLGTDVTDAGILRSLLVTYSTTRL